MEIDRFGVKLFLSEPLGDVRSVVPLFHTWIQKQAVEGHLLIDVHDYAHIHHGPGILLVGHEGNFSMDMAEGRPGLLYYRKQPLPGEPDERFEAILKSTFRGCQLLEDDTTIGGRLRFRTGELRIVANDRLHLPNNENTFAEVQPILSRVLERLLQGAAFTLTHSAGDPRERFAVSVHMMEKTPFQTLLARLP